MYVHCNGLHCLLLIARTPAGQNPSPGEDLVAGKSPWLWSGMQVMKVVRVQVQIHTRKFVTWTIKHSQQLRGIIALVGLQ